MKKFNFVFITTNLKNGKQYIGDHSTDNLNDNYLGSGRPYFQRALKEYGKENFERNILEHFPTKQEAFDAQKHYIIEYNTLVPNGYNLSPKGGHGAKDCWSEESKKKSSNTQSGRSTIRKGKTYEEIYGEEYAKKIKQKQKIKATKRYHTEKSKKKMSESHKGKPVWNKGKHHKPESIEKIKIARKKQSETNGEYWSGKHRSEETKLKISNTLKKRNNDKFNI